MRKSTLITTIAMIVVVVVALSTATYAWFTSSSTSEASQTISSNAEAELLLQEGKLSTTNTTSTDITWSLASAAISLEGLAGLYSPVGALTRTVTGTALENSQVSSRAKETFVRCLEVTEGAKVEAVKQLDPTFIRAYNATTGTMKVYLTILIDLGSDATKLPNAKAAAAALTFDIKGVAAIQGPSSVTETPIAYTLGYRVTAAKTDGTAYAIGNMATESASSVDPEKGSGDNVLTQNRPDYIGAGSKTFPTANADIKSGEETIVAESNTYLAYTICLGDIATENAVCIALYSWIDGWVATNAAANNTLKVHYVFSKNNPITTATSFS